MDDTKNWIKSLENHYASLWKTKGLSVNPRNNYVLDGSNSALFYPSVYKRLKLEQGNFHSPFNPKSSQILAMNLFYGLENVIIKILGEQFKKLEISTLENIKFEWVPGQNKNVLQQAGKKSNHDVLIESVSHKFLIEMKFTEHGPAPCGTSAKDENCKKNIDALVCPLETKYGTKYHSLIKEDNSPYNLPAIAKRYTDCPFLHGEQYQLMRYILYCYEMNKAYKKKWVPIIIYPKQNKFIDLEVNITKELLNEQDYLQVIYLDSLIKSIKNHDQSRGDWLQKQYIEVKSYE